MGEYQDWQEGRRVALPVEPEYQALFESLVNGSDRERDLAALLFSEPAEWREPWYRLGFRSKAAYERHIRWRRIGALAMFALLLILAIVSFACSMLASGR